MPQTEVKSQVEELAVESLETFCDDIGGMFGIDMACTAQAATVETARTLAKPYKKLAALFTIQSTGALDGHFHIVVDKEGLFTLSGTIVMLPEKRILDMCKKGTQKDAEELHDAVGETGNLIVGSWDRIFREGLATHGHFLQTGTFIGIPWSSAPETLGVADDEEFTYIPFEMTVGEFPAFQCGVIFPNAIFEEKAAPEPAEAETEAADSLADDETPADEPAPEAAAPADIEEAAPATGDTPEAAAVDEPATPEPAEAAADTTEPVEPETPAPVATPAAPATVAANEPAGQVTQSIQKIVNSFPALPGEGLAAFLKVPASAVMQPHVVWAHPDDSVQQAMTLMQESDAGYLMVGDNGVLEGIVSWVDLIGAVSIYLKPVFAKWRRPADDATLQIKLKVIMTRPVRTAKPETALSVLMDNMSRHGLRCLPIVDAQSRVQGLVTAFDIFQALLNTDADITTVGRPAQHIPVE